MAFPTKREDVSVVYPPGSPRTGSPARAHIAAWVEHDTHRMGEHDLAVLRSALEAFDRAEALGASFAEPPGPSPTALVTSERDEARRKLNDVAEMWKQEKAEKDAATAALAMVKLDIDDVWRWQGGDDDEPASLACPVVMTAETVRKFLGRIAELEDTIDLMRAWTDSTPAEIPEDEPILSPKAKATIAAIKARRGVDWEGARERTLDATVPAEETLRVARKHLQVLLDAAVGSLDFGSGFFDDEEVEALRATATLLGVDPMTVTPRNFVCKYTGGHDPYGPDPKAHKMYERMCKRCKAIVDTKDGG